MPSYRWGMNPTGNYQKVVLPWHRPETVQQHEENIRALERIDWGNGSGIRWATIVIAASNSTPASRATADYVCTSTNAGTVINNAINTLISQQSGGSTPLGRIVLLEGTYNVGTTPIGTSNLGGRSLHIQGMGGVGRSDTFAGTRVVSTTTQACNFVGSGSGGGSSIMLSDIQFVSGSSSNYTVSLQDIPAEVTRCSVINTSSGGGIGANDTTGSSAATMIYDNYIYVGASGSNYGVKVSGGAAVDQPCLVSNNIIRTTGATGGILGVNQINTVPTYLFTDNVVWGTSNGLGSFGILIAGNSSQNGVVSGNNVRSHQEGIICAGYRHNIVGNLIQSCAIGIDSGAFTPQLHYIVGNHITGAATYGIRVTQSHDTCTVAYNKISGHGGATQAIRIESGCTNTGVFMNDTYGGYSTTEISDAGTNTRRESWMSGIHGLPTGGTTGQALVKNSGTDYDTTWSSAIVPAGGTTGQVLAKVSGSNYDTTWNSSGNPSGGTTGQILAKNSNTSYDYSWTTVAGAAGETIKVDGATIGARTILALISGTNVTLSGTDTGTQIEVTVNASGGGGGGGSSAATALYMYQQLR